MHKMTKKEKYTTIAFNAVLISALAILIIINWSSIFQSIQLNFIKANNYIEILKGLANTLLITFCAFVMGIIIGSFISFIDEWDSNSIFAIIIKKIAKGYVSIFRGTPMLVQLLIIYFVIFVFYKGNPLWIAIFAFGLNSGAYVSEIIRGGVQSIPLGQMEAGRSLGLSYKVVMMKIIYPQAFRNALPSIGNELIALVKETSIAGFIGAIDLTLAFRKIANATYDYQTVYLVMGVVYFLLVFLLTKLLGFVERRLLSYARV